MHGPENSWEDNFKVWGAMEEGFDQGKVKQLGISNWYRLEDIQYLYDHARIKPKVKILEINMSLYLCHAMYSFIRCVYLNRLYKIDSTLIQDTM